MIERKYIVLSISDVEKFLKDEEKSALSSICEHLRAGRNSESRMPIDGIFIDKSWGDVYEGAKNLLTEALHNTVKPLELNNSSDNRYDLCKGVLVYHKGYNPHSGRQPGDVYRIEQVSDRGICVVYESGNKPNSGYRTDFFTKRGFDETWSFTNDLDTAVNDDDDGYKVGDTVYFTRDESPVTGRRLGDAYEITQVRSTGISIKFVSGNKPRSPVYIEDTVSKKYFSRFWSFTNPLFEGVKVGVQIEPTHSFSCRKPGEVYEITAVDEGSITYKYVGGGAKPPLRLIGFTGRSWFFERWKIL